MMDCDVETPYDILHSTDSDRWLQATSQVKHLVIGSNMQKEAAIETHAILPRLLEFLINEENSQDLRTEAAIVLGSLAWGSSENIKSLVRTGAVQALIKGLWDPSKKHVEACLRCLRTVFMAPDPPYQYLYEEAHYISHLLTIISSSANTKECIAHILANCCKCAEHQNKLFERGAIEALAPLLLENYKIQMPVLKCFAAMCYNNENVCQAVAQFTFNGTSVPDLINRLQSRSNTSEMQMAAAKCLTFLHRGNAIQADSPIIRLETLPTLVRMCKKDRTLEENVEGAETLAYLIQQDKDLQMIASICDHSMRALAEYLSYTEIQQVDLSNQTPRKKVDWGSLLKQAAFKAFAAIGANDEKIREKIIAIDGLMDSVVMGMNSEDPNVQVAACRCLHSLSRSVQTIRTTFQDHAVWKPLVKLTQSDSTEVTKMASSTLCNLLLVFSPCKEALLNTGAIQIIVAMTKHKDYDIRLNGVWSLMNLTYCLDLERKKDVLTELGDKHLAALLAETDYHIQCRMMGFLANLINMKADKEPESSHRDAVLSTQIGKIMQQGVKSILCNDTLSGKVKDLALAVLSSMVENVELKTAMLQDDMFLRRVADYLDVKELTLSTVAVFRSLIGCDQDLQKSERIQVLKDKGIWHRLQRHIQK